MTEERHQNRGTEEWCCPPLLKLQTQFYGHIEEAVELKSGAHSRDIELDHRLERMAEEFAKKVDDAVNPLKESVNTINKRMNAVFMWVVGVLGSFVIALVVVLLQHQLDK